MTPQSPQPSAPDRRCVERRVYKETSEYSDYLSARFGENGLRPAHSSFEWQGHRWQYKHSSFDDAGDFCVIFRWEEAPAPQPSAPDLEAIRKALVKGYAQCFTRKESDVYDAAFAALKALRNQLDAPAPQPSSTGGGALDLALAACRAALEYDRALSACANDPKKMFSFCSAQGDNLDSLYFDWVNKSRAALKAATGSEHGQG